MNASVPGRSEARRAARSSVQLEFKHSPELPITQQREAICSALEHHQVLIVAGDTGSGKSTQLPQYCLEMGRGVDGLIAHTQPRRLAARALATRIADEFGQVVGRSVGYRVRFADRVSDATRLVLLTDGLLLAEIAGDPLLSRYDTVIVDEAHERSLNVDLLLGVLKQLLPRRPDLKLIVTSATLDVERVAEFFDSAPVIRVSGRGFPIEVRFTPLQEADEEPDLAVAVLAAYREISSEPGDIGRGDVLVFLPGEREIRDVGELLERELRQEAEVLTLYSRLSWEQQSRIFERGTRRRIVLSTNVAETSVTVPGIRAVIDSGLARISRYSSRNRLQRLPIERIARAGADQRKGRCGRIGAGLCIRLYGEDDFAARPAFTEPEILRTNLAALLLRLAADGLGDAEAFPFIDAPDTRALNDGYRLLQELQALDGRRITRRGRAMARLPLDPRLARALLESQRFHAEAELLAIVAGLSVPEVRIVERAAPRGGTAAEADAGPESVFQDNKSEFVALSKLFRAYRRMREGPRRELRRWCKERQLSLLRLSEWDDVYSQVADRARELGIVAQPQAASYTGVHRALLAGFCTTVGVREEEGTYLGTRGVHFLIFPGSPLARRRPRWVMAANIVETTRVFARCVAEIEPKWIESAAAHLLKHEYLEPDYDEVREEVVARERIGFLGLTLSANRLVNYGPIAPELSRRIFAREALVYQRLPNRPAWLRRNDAAVRAAKQMEERLRSRDLVLNAEAFVDFYDHALPRQVSSAATIEYFSRHLTPSEETALTMNAEQIFAREPDALALSQFPEQTRIQALDVPVQYRFAPGETGDGATLTVPLLALPGMTRATVDAAVPGLALPRVEALLRSLPKDARRLLIPMHETAQAYVRAAVDTPTDLSALGNWLKEHRGVPEGLLRFDATTLPDFLTVQIRVLERGRELALDSDLGRLRRTCATAAQRELERMSRMLFDAAAWRRFEAAEIPEHASIPLEQGEVTLFPTLQMQAGQLHLQLAWTAAEAQHAWADAAPRLARLMLAPQARDLAKAISSNVPLLLSATPFLSSDALRDLILQRVFQRACFADGVAPRTRAAFEAAVEHARTALYPTLDEVMQQLKSWFVEATAIRRAQDVSGVVHAMASDESRAHLAQLLSADMMFMASPVWLGQYPRYLKAELRRWQKNSTRATDDAVVSQMRQWQERLELLRQRVLAEMRWLPALDDLAFWIEEFRVSIYAQELKTFGPVSQQRLEGRVAGIEAWLKR